MTDPRQRRFSGIVHLIMALIAMGSLLAVAWPPSTSKATVPNPAPGLALRSASQTDHPFGEPTGPLSERHVYDLANALSGAQIATIESDARRLQRFDLPALVITVNADITPDQASAIADSVRRDWNVETSQGADDGLAFIIWIPISDQGSAFATLSWGANALPHDGIDRAVVEQIEQRWIEPWLAEPDVFEAATYGLRRLIYHAIYDPAPAAPLSQAQEIAQVIIRWSAPMTVLGVVALRYAALDWRGHAGVMRHPVRVREFGTVLPSFLLGPLSIWAHSTVGVVSTVILLFIALVGWMRHDPGNTASGTLDSSSPIRRGASA